MFLEHQISILEQFLKRKRLIIFVIIFHNINVLLYFGTNK